MKLSAYTTGLRIIVQLALSGAVIVLCPYLVVLSVRLMPATVQGDWSGDAMGVLAPLGLVGVIALCLSTGVTRRFFTRGIKRRVFILGGLVSGLLVDAVLCGRMVEGSVNLQRDWLPLYLTAGPAIVAIWNIYRFWRWTNQPELNRA